MSRVVYNRVSMVSPLLFITSSENTQSVQGKHNKIIYTIKSMLKFHTEVAGKLCCHVTFDVKMASTNGQDSRKKFS